MRSRKATFAVTKNLLRNLVVRDSVPICESFDLHYGSKLSETDKLFSEAAFLFFIATREDTGLHENYKRVLIGLVKSALNNLWGCRYLGSESNDGSVDGIDPAGHRDLCHDHSHL